MGGIWYDLKSEKQKLIIPKSQFLIAKKTASPEGSGILKQIARNYYAGVLVRTEKSFDVFTLELRELRFRSSKWRQGTKNNANRVAPITPPAIHTAKGGQDLPPSIQRGIKPATVVKVVVITWRVE